jgi:hypothetical protein
MTDGRNYLTILNEGLLIDIPLGYISTDSIFNNFYCLLDKLDELLFSLPLICRRVGTWTGQPKKGNIRWYIICVLSFFLFGIRTLTIIVSLLTSERQNPHYGRLLK